MTTFDINKLDWKKMNNLIPAIIQNAKTGKVLMLGYMNQASLLQTLSTKRITFYSRSKKRLWTKGESSGNYLTLSDLTYDCDDDCLLAFVEPEGPTCHKGEESCFKKTFSSAKQSDWSTIAQLEEIILERSETNSKTSYTSQLLNSGIDRVAQKVGEEAVEVVIAALTSNASICDTSIENKNSTELMNNFLNECADLFFHLLILLRFKNISISNVIAILRERME